MSRLVYRAEEMSSQNESKEKPGKTRCVVIPEQHTTNQNRIVHHSQPMRNKKQNRKAEREKVTIAKAITSITDWLFTQTKSKVDQ